MPSSSFLPLSAKAAAATWSFQAAEGSIKRMDRPLRRMNDPPGCVEKSPDIGARRISMPSDSARSINAES